MFLSLSSKFNNYIERITDINPFTQLYALGRSLLALSTLTVFIFNNLHYIFDKDALNVISNSNFFYNKINLFGIVGYDNLIYAWIFSIIVLLSVIIGYYPKITGILHFWIVYSLYNGAILLDGGDQVSTILSFMILPLTLMDRRKNHWDLEKTQSNSSKLAGHIIFSLITLQVFFMYLNTAIEKLYRLDDWKNGTALYYIFKNPFFGLNDFLIKIFDPIINSKLVFFITWWVIISHLILALSIGMRRDKKKLVFWIGVIFHSGIAVFLGLYSFSIAMFGALAIYCLPFNYQIIKKK